MISEDLIDMLIDPDPEVRKRGVMQLGKSKDPEALPYLAEVYRDDEDEEVRELARKAGLFIRKSAPAKPSGGRSSAQTAPRSRQPEPSESSYADLYTGGESLYADEDDDADEDVYANADESPLPSELKVSAVQEERARGLVQQALDLNMRGDNQRALKALEKALHTDPRLMYQNYTISLASTLTGMDGREAMKSIGPSADDLKKRTGSGAGGKRSGSQIILAYSLLMGGVIVLLGFFLFTWIDLTAIPTLDENGNPTTIGDTMDQAQEQIDQLLEMAGDTPEARTIRDAFNGLTFEFNGMDTALISIGAVDFYEALGINAFMEATFGSLGTDTAELDDGYEPAPLDYTLVLIPIVAVVAGLMGILLLLNSKISYWIFAIVMGLVGIVPLAYFYTSAINDVVPTDADLSSFGELNIPSASDLIGIGFWVSLVGMLIIIIVPFLAMLTMPSKTSEF